MKKNSLLILLFVLKLNICFSQWSQTDGPYSNTNVSAIIEHDSLLIASTNCGSFHIKELSARWEQNSNVAFSRYTKKGDSLFIGSWDGIKLFNLSQLNIPPLPVSSYTAKALAHSDSCLYLGNDRQGFMKSNNGGLSWLIINKGLPVDSSWNPLTNSYYYEIDVTNIEVTANYIFCGTNKGVYRSIGNLNKWTGINSGLPIAPITLIKEFNDTLYTVIANKLYKSIDQGNNWLSVHTLPSNITTIIKHKSRIYLGTVNNGVYYSDNEVNWNVINFGLTDLAVNVLAVFDSNLVCGTNTKGVFYLKNGQWISNRTGMICSSISSIATKDNSLVANDNRQVFISENRNTWASVSIPNIPSYPNLPSGIGSVVTMGDTIFMSYKYTTPNFPFDHAFVQYTADKGNTWQNLINNIPYAGDDAPRIYSSGKRLYATEDGKMFYTDNLGATWIDISLSSPFCNYFYGFTIKESTPFAITCGNEKVLKLNSNNQWVTANSGLPANLAPQALAFCDSAMFLNSSNYGMYVSFDNGNNWAPVNNVIPTGFSIRSFVNRGSSLYVATEKGVFNTKDFGKSWVVLNDGLKNIQTSSIKILQDTLYVGTLGSGVWKLPIPQVEPPVKNKQQTESVKIFPNPANEKVVLEGEKPLNGIVTLTGLHGRTMWKETIIKSNEKVIPLENLPAGVYILRFSGQDGRQFSSKVLKQ